MRFDRTVPALSGLRHRWSRRASLALAVAVAPVVFSSAATAGEPPLGHGAGNAVGPAAAASSSTRSIVVRERVPSSGHAERVVRSLGGTVTRQLPIVGGFSGRIPADMLRALVRSRHVVRVWPDARVRMSDDDDDDLEEFDSRPADAVWRQAVRLPPRGSRYDGSRVTVALLDTGVAAVTDLGSRVSARVDFTPDGDGIDRYGHGTHLAAIIAGDGRASSGRWAGVARRAKIVSVKVAGADGATDVSIVLAGLQWVVANRDRFKIRVVNLSFGTDSTQSYRIDPLDYAVERAWASGILVVTAAGNRGPSPGTVSKPGDDPYVLTVGAVDTRGTAEGTDDEVAEFSSRGPTGDGVAKPDLVAPGVTIVSSRVRSSTIDVLRPAARVDRAYFKGTGTSQAAAIVSGIAALMFQADPSLSPDVVKAALAGTATRDLASQDGVGGGVVDATRALDAVVAKSYEAAPANEGLTPSTGLGSLEASRGSYRAVADLDGDDVPEEATGEIDVLGNAWDAGTWAPAPWTAAGWPTSPWYPLVTDSSLTSVGGDDDDGGGDDDGGDDDDDDDGSSRNGSRSQWGGVAWDAKTWSAKTWSGDGWDAKTWSAKTWSAGLWN